MGSMYGHALNMYSMEVGITLPFDFIVKVKVKPDKMHMRIFLELAYCICKYHKVYDSSSSFLHGQIMCVRMKPPYITFYNVDILHYALFGYYLTM